MHRFQHRTITRTTPIQSSIDVDFSSKNSGRGISFYSLTRSFPFTMVAQYTVAGRQVGSHVVSVPSFLQRPVLVVRSKYIQHKQLTRYLYHSSLSPPWVSLVPLWLSRWVEARRPRHKDPQSRRQVMTRRSSSGSCSRHRDYTAHLAPVGAARGCMAV